LGKTQIFYQIVIYALNVFSHVFEEVAYGVSVVAG
jgi:hypothetical protein